MLSNYRTSVIYFVSHLTSLMIVLFAAILIGDFVVVALTHISTFRAGVVVEAMYPTVFNPFVFGLGAGGTLIHTALCAPDEFVEFDN